MKPNEITLYPFPKGLASITLGLKGLTFYTSLGPGRLVFAVDTRWLFVVLFPLLAIVFWPSTPKANPEAKVYHIATDSLSSLEDLLPPDLNPSLRTQLVNEFYEERLEKARDIFLREKQKLLFEAVIAEKVARADQLSQSKLLETHKYISRLFMDLILKNAQAPGNVWHFFADTTDLAKIETALMEQARFHIPASITLAQAALESAWGQRVPFNNFFGIKAKKGQKAGSLITTEFLSAKELKTFEGEIIHQEQAIKQGTIIYKCKVMSAFAAYPTPWASFRARSVYLSSQPRYAPLFTGGKDYKAWAKKLGATRDGGVGYATSPEYGQLLLSIIERYQLHLLDH